MTRDDLERRFDGPIPQELKEAAEGERACNRKAIARAKTYIARLDIEIERAGDSVEADVMIVNRTTWKLHLEDLIQDSVQY